MYPRRLGAGRHGAAPSLRPVNTERAGARRKYETGGTRLSRPMWGTDADGVRPRQVRNGRDALVASDGGTDADGVRPRQARPSRVLDLYDNPIISRPLSIRSFPIPLQWVKQRKPTSKPISVSPSLRALRVDRPEATRCTRAASARDAGRQPRASGRSTRSARGHGGNTKREGRACRVRWGDGRRRGADATSTKREGRACRVRWGGRTPTGCDRDKRVPPAVSFTAYHGWTLPCFFSRSCPSPVAFSSALSGRVSSSRTFRAGSSPCRVALS